MIDLFSAVIVSADLQTTFYIVGIVYMIVMLVIVIAILTMILAIKAKIDAAHQAVVDKIDMTKRVTQRVMTLLNTARFFVR